MRSIQATTMTLALATALAVEAHEGHGVVKPGNSLLHYLTEPLHIIPLLLAAGIVVLVVRALRNKGKNRKRDAD